METKLLDEIIACLPKERTLFRYARNDYALMLLSRAVGKGMRISELKQSSFGRLLNKPVVQNLLSEMGGGYLSGDLLNYVYVKERQNFLLTVGRWNDERSRYNQTTRNGANLVLQMNFNSGHDQAFNHFVDEDERWYFESCGHPVLLQGERTYYRNTLAWVRLDIDFDTNEVLIEEIQNDWLRDARHWWKNKLEDAKQARKTLDKKCMLRAAKGYMEKNLADYYRLWDEAALTAAINFIVDELGISTLYYHTFDTGNVLKGLRYSQPPRSLYTDLPNKFCFQLTDEVPKLFGKSIAAKRKLRRAQNPYWYRLNMEALQ